MSTSIQFLGGAGTVTGSKFLIESDGDRILVDAGLFQGLKELRVLNRVPLPIDPKSLSAVLLTHAHLDHTGYLPLLVRGGYRGPIYATEPTRELTGLVLRDAAHLQEEDADYANKKGYSKHDPAEPLFTTGDAERAIFQIVPVPLLVWNFPIPKRKDIRFRLTLSGHILGSTFIELQIGKKKIVFSGDLGRVRPLTFATPSIVEKADFLLIESTYGDRNHDKTPVLNTLERITQETIQRKGFLLIPSFAIGRTQDLIYCYYKLRKQNKIPELPIYIDSPMGISATNSFIRFKEWHKISDFEVNEMMEMVTLVKGRDQSKALLKRKPSAVIIAGSGMVTGGRILHHLAVRLPEKRNTVLLVGFQAMGSRGRYLQEGAQEIKIHGQYVKVQCRIETMGTLSAHADQSEILHWLHQFTDRPKTTFIVHGEPQAADFLRIKIQDKLAWNVVVAKHLEKIQIF